MIHCKNKQLMTFQRENIYYLALTFASFKKAKYFFAFKIFNFL